MAAPVGIVANPAAGRDVRRLVGYAGTSTIQDKASTIQRVALGAAGVGATQFCVLGDASRLGARAFEALGRHLDWSVVDVVPKGDERDSTTGAAALRAAGCAVVVVLGGDGTNRAVALGWPDAPVIPLSTGTNNAFPQAVEPTSAGMVAGLIATGRLAAGEVAHPAKVVRARHGHGPEGLALVDVLVLADGPARSMDLFDPVGARVAVLSRAEPASVGVAAAGAAVDPCSVSDPYGLVVRFAPPAAARRTVTVAWSPGVVASLGLASCERVGLGVPVLVEGPAVLAYDGERHERLGPGEHVELRVCVDGPRVVDVRAALALAASRRLLG